MSAVRLIGFAVAALLAGRADFAARIDTGLDERVRERFGREETLPLERFSERLPQTIEAGLEKIKARRPASEPFTGEPRPPAPGRPSGNCPSPRHGRPRCGTTSISRSPGSIRRSPALPCPRRRLNSTP